MVLHFRRTAARKHVLCLRNETKFNMRRFAESFFDETNICCASVDDKQSSRQRVITRKRAQAKT